MKIENYPMRHQAFEGEADVQTQVLALRLSTARVLFLTVVSSGLYLFYWFYLTWKQLEPETRESHYPVWHTLTLFVPIYGLLRMYRHFSVINGLAGGLSPAFAVISLIVINFLDLNSFGTTNLTTLVVRSIVSAALTAGIIACAQNSLNRYWEQQSETKVCEAPLGKGEVIFGVLGLLLWAGMFIPLPA